MSRMIYNFFHETLKIKHKWAFKTSTACYYDMRAFRRHGLFR